MFTYEGMLHPIGKVLTSYNGLSCNNYAESVASWNIVWHYFLGVLSWYNVHILYAPGKIVLRVTQLTTVRYTSFLLHRLPAAVK